MIIKSDEYRTSEERKEIECEMTLISAQEARRRTLDFINESDSKQLSEIASLIQRKVEIEHVYHLYYGKQISLSVKLKLESAGYKVTDCSTQRDGICYQIQW